MSKLCAQHDGKGMWYPRVERDDLSDSADKRVQRRDQLPELEVLER